MGQVLSWCFTPGSTDTLTRKSAKGQHTSDCVFLCVYMSDHFFQEKCHSLLLETMRLRTVCQGEKRVREPGL